MPEGYVFSLCSEALQFSIPIFILTKLYHWPLLVDPIPLLCFLLSPFCWESFLPRFLFDSLRFAFQFAFFDNSVFIEFYFHAFYRLSYFNHICFVLPYVTFVKQCHLCQYRTHPDTKFTARKRFTSLEGPVGGGHEKGVELRRQKSINQAAAVATGSKQASICCRSGFLRRKGEVDLY